MALAGAGAAAELNLFATSYFFLLRMTGIEKRRGLNKSKKAQQAKKKKRLITEVTGRKRLDEEMRLTDFISLTFRVTLSLETKFKK